MYVTNLLICFILALVSFPQDTYAAPPYKRVPAPIPRWQRYPSLQDATIDELQDGLTSKQFTSVDLVNAYLKRIEEVNGQLHSVTELNPDALALAAELDAERKAGTSRGPLHGIPILIKNNIATNDKMNNTAGSYALLGTKVPRDSTIAAKLRAAGAIILGKANLSQWANYRSSNSSNGWSALGGQVYGPFYPNQDPSGSSSGSAVSSTLGLSAGSLGTETSGSLLSPASKNNIITIKPSVGLTSRNLVIPISEHQDTIGPMTTTVKDAAIILQAIAGVDKNDNYTSAIPNNGVLPDYVAACNLAALSGARIGIPRNVIALSSSSASFAPQLAAFESAISTLKAAGATIVENTNFTNLTQYLNSPAPNQVLEADFPVDLKAYLDVLTANPNHITNLAVLRNFTQHYMREEYPDRDTAVWDDILDVQRWNNTDPRFWAAYQQVLFFGTEGGLLGAIRRNKLDAVILPTDRAASYAAGVGAPGISVPLGFYPANSSVVRTARGLVSTAPGVPFGLTFLGDRFSEAKLIGLAYAFEQKTLVRAKGKPYITPKTEIGDVVGSPY